MGCSMAHSTACLGMACLSPGLYAPGVTPALCGVSRDAGQCSPVALCAATGSGKAAQLNQPSGGLARLPAWGLQSPQDSCRLKAPLVSWPCAGARGDVARRPVYASAQSLSAEESLGPLVEEGGRLELDAATAVGRPGEGEEAEVLIELKDVYKSFGEKHILRGASFKIRQGEAVGIIGPSGTGKSTVLKVMAGLLAPDKGEVWICGKKREGLLDDGDTSSGLRIGLVFQSAALFDSLTVQENVGFLLYEHSDLDEAEIEQRVKDSLLAVGLKGVEHRLPSELSGGMRKRVALARAIIAESNEPETEREVVMYDEPTAGLDPIASTVVEDLVRSLHIRTTDTGLQVGKIASYIVVTHQHSTIRRAVDRLLFLYDGRVQWEGPTEEFDTTQNPLVRQFASGSLEGPIQYI